MYVSSLHSQAHMFQAAKCNKMYRAHSCRNPCWQRTVHVSQSDGETTSVAAFWSRQKSLRNCARLDLASRTLTRPKPVAVSPTEVSKCGTKNTMALQNLGPPKPPGPPLNITKPVFYLGRVQILIGDTHNTTGGTPATSDRSEAAGRRLCIAQVWRRVLKHG